MQRFRPVTKRFPVPRGGRLDSNDVSAFVNGVVNDLELLRVLMDSILDEQNGTNLRLRLLEQEATERSAVAKGAGDAARAVGAMNGGLLVYDLNVRDSDVVSHVPEATHQNRAMIDTVFGLATSPLNAIEHRFYTENVDTGVLLPLQGVQISVTGTFDAGDGLTNYEEGATVDEGVPAYAINGNNDRHWVRRIEFPLESDVSYVKTEITIVIPRQLSTVANFVYVVPFPAGDIDIDGIYGCADLVSSFSMLSGFSAVRSAGPTKHYFPSTLVQRLKVRFTQRNWVEEDGKKVFYVGAQEIGLGLADFDKTYDSEGTVSENHSFVLEAAAPDGYAFVGVSKLLTNPLYSLETAGLRHIHIRLCADSSGNTVLWDSDSDPAPETTPVAFSQAPTLYWIVTLNYALSSGGPSSPFPVGTPGYLRGLSFEGSVEEIV